MRAHLQAVSVFIAALLPSGNAFAQMIGQMSAPITAERSVEIFLGVCRATADRRFADATAKMAEYGITIKVDTGEISSETENVFVVISDGPEDRKTCSMTFRSKNTSDQVKDALPNIGAFRDTPYGQYTVMEGDIVVIYDDFGGLGGGDGSLLHRLSMISDKE